MTCLENTILNMCKLLAAYLQFGVSDGDNFSSKQVLPQNHAGYTPYALTSRPRYITEENMKLSGKCTSTLALKL